MPLVTAWILVSSRSGIGVRFTVLFGEAVMSADAWRECPRCRKTAEAAREKRLAKAQRSYGKVPAEDYAKMISEANSPVELEETLREDYEQGIDDDGKYYVSFHASCQSCDYDFSYRHEQQTDV